MKQIQEDKIISEFLKSLGPWREFIVIGGGFALLFTSFTSPIPSSRISLLERVILTR